MPQELKITPEAPKPERAERTGGKESERHPRRELATPQERVPGSAQGFSVPQTETQSPQSLVPRPSIKPPETQAVETLLEEDLTEVYARMPADRQAAFRKKGEETTRKIVSVLHKARSRAKDILGWIREWLRIIPGVNKFFLEQESKIKTDKIVALSERSDRNQ